MGIVGQGQASILSIGTAVPEVLASSADVKRYIRKAFDLDERRLAVMDSVIDNSRIQTRHMLFPLDYTIQPRPLACISTEYKTHAIRLGRQAVEEALQSAGCEPRDIDLFVTVSCTGVMIPSVDAYLMNEMGFRPDTRRLPVTELGCAAGAAALARASDYIRAYPDANVLVLAVELTSLTFQRHDTSPAHLISCALFGDGAAAAVLSGRDAPGLRIVGTRSYLIPNSLDAMGFDLRDSGFHIVLSKNVPQMVRDEIGAATESLLARHGIRREDLRFCILHPGGQKLLAFVEEELGVSGTLTASSWKVLAEYGNLSSATVLFVAREFLAGPAPQSGDMGLLAAFGPGFSMEMALLEWR
jgi:alkylresorcinol/alkylpyrone synthase